MTPAVRHLLSGAVFPGLVPGFLTGELTIYDDWGHDMSVGYAWPAPDPEAQLTVYVVAAAGQSDAAYLEESVSAIYGSRPKVEVVGHDRSLVGDHAGLRVDLLVPGKNGDAEPRASTIHVFAVAEWFVKVRATASSALHNRAVALSSEALLQHFGWPRPRRHALARLDAERARAAEAMAAFDTVCLQCTDDSEGTRRLRQARADLQAGRMCRAVLHYTELTEGRHVLRDAFAAALEAYLPAAFRLGQGLGTSLTDPIEIESDTGGDAWLAVCYRYLGCVLGDRLDDWDVEACDVVVADSGLVDALRIRTPTGERATVFVAIPGTGRSLGGHGKVLARWEWSDGGTVGESFPQIAIPDVVPEALSDSLQLHLWSHTAHWLLTRRE
jgi:hypothetical protein